MAIANKMRIHGDKMADVTIIEKILRSMTTKFNYVVCSIEESKDTDRAENESARQRGASITSLSIKRRRSRTRKRQRCHKFGHYKSNCCTNLRRDGGKQSNFAEKEEEVSLLMACHSKEETHKKFLWYLDTCCSNHMSGEKFVFSELDEAFRDVVKFGDGSIVSVMGKGKVAIQTNRNSIQTISNVLFVPDLRTNLLSVGQLQERGYEISIKNGVYRIEDEKLGLIAQVNMTTNRMFPLYLHDTTHSCLSTRLGEKEWLWHFRYGHLSFNELKTLQQKNMVTGLPQITAPSKVCEKCVVSK
ncbi:uncharacterized protein LOC126689560 [Quercus robur]|uniref:uncharacterized protein LOC126689560 n=1 Tax=Quercus robur TaxID=38942 RepID=UPI00216138BF|nr:uncharacterized protein LOC126689560 [Quercus robur]